MSATLKRSPHLWLVAVIGLALLWPLCGRAQPDASSLDTIRKHRVELFAMAGREHLKQMAGNILQFASDSEHCRIAYGSKACGLPSEALKGGELKQVFDYYVKQPMDAALDQRQPSAHREDWNWNPDLKQSGGSGDKQ